MKKFLSFFILSISFIGSIHPQSFKKTPYLLFHNDNTQMTVMWQLDTVISTIINWGETLTYDNSDTVLEFGNDHQFKFTINGLNPETKYFYKVSIDSINKTGSFYTAKRDTSKNVSFYIYGDTRDNPDIQNNVTGEILAQINNDPLSQTFCLMAGDCVGFGRTEDAWQNQFFDQSYSNNELLKRSLPLIIARGNHENFDTNYNCGNATIFYKYWTYSFADSSTNGNDMYHSFDYGPVHIAVLDQYNNNSYDPGEISPTELAWLQSDLSNSNKPWKFILLHEPGWSADSISKSGHGNNLDVQNNIQPLCIQYGVQAIFGGHNHYYAHCLVDSIHHFTLGGGGAPLYSPFYTSGGYVVFAEKTYHFMKIKIEDKNATLTVIRPDGSTVDSINLSLPNNNIPENTIKNIINVYPNPSNGDFFVETKNYRNGIIYLKNLKGQTLTSKQITSKMTRLNIDNFSKGEYIIQVEVNGKSFSKKIILE